VSSSTNSVLPLVAQLGGPVSALAIAGSCLYVGAGPRLIVWDIADPAQPRRLGASAPLEGVVVSIAVRGRTAYVALEDRTAVYVFDVAGGEPRLIVTAALRPAPLQRIAASGDVLFVADDKQRLAAFRLPTQPEAGFLALWKRSLHVGRANDLATNGTSVAVLTASRGVRLVDVRISDSPRLAGTWQDREPGGHEARWLALVDDRLFVPSRQEVSSTRIAVVDIGDPDVPQLVERIDLQDVDGYVTTTAGTGAHLFVGCHARGRVSIHLRQADARLARVGQLGEPAIADAPVAPTEGGAFVLQEQHELAFYADQPNGPECVRAVDLKARLAFESSLAQRAGVAYLANRTNALLIDSDQVRPLEIGAEKPQTSWLQSMAVDGTDLLLAANDGLAVLDVRDPHSPRWRTTIELPTAAAYVNREAAIAASHVYTIDNIRLAVYAVGDGDRPQLVGSCPVDAAWSDAYVTVIAVADGWVVAGGVRGGLRLFDVRNPRSPRLLATVAGMDARDVALDGDRLLVATDTAIVWFDRSVPARPALVGHCLIPGQVKHVRVVGDQAWVTTTAGGLAIVSLAPVPQTAVVAAAAVARVPVTQPEPRRTTSRGAAMTLAAAARLAIQVAAEAHALLQLREALEAFIHLADLQPRGRDSFVPGLLDESARLAHAFDRHARQLDRAAQDLGRPSEAFRRMGYAAQELRTLQRMRGLLLQSDRPGWSLVETGRVFGVLVEANADTADAAIDGRLELYHWAAPDQPLGYAWRLRRSANLRATLADGDGLEMRPLAQPPELPESVAGALYPGRAGLLLEDLARQLVVLWVLGHLGPDGDEGGHGPDGPFEPEPTPPDGGPRLAVVPRVIPATSTRHPLRPTKLRRAQGRPIPASRGWREAPGGVEAERRRR